MHMVSKRDLTLPSWRPWGCRGILRRWWQPIQRKNDSVCQSGKLYLSKLFLEETPAVLSLETLCEKSWVCTSLDERWKTTSHQKWQANWLQYIELMCHLWFVVHQRFLLHLRFHFSFHHRHPWSHCVPKKKVRTANGEVQTREEATVFVKELDFFVNVMLLEETTAVLSFGKLCEVWKELIHTSHFLVFACTHNSGAHDIRSRWLTASRHPCFMCSVWFGLSLRLSTLHSSPSLSSSLSFFWFSSLSSMWVGYTPLPRGSWVNLPLDQRSKTTSPRKWQEHQL